MVKAEGRAGSLNILDTNPRMFNTVVKTAPGPSPYMHVCKPQTGANQRPAHARTPNVCPQPRLLGHTHTRLHGTAPINGQEARAQGPLFSFRDKHRDGTSRPILLFRGGKATRSVRAEMQGAKAKKELKRPQGESGGSLESQHANVLAPRAVIDSLGVRPNLKTRGV